jgi:glucose/arabinose dehydrogenase
VRRSIVIAGLLSAAVAFAAPAAAQSPAYEIPPDNPFVGTAGARPEIYVTGMRNPFRWSFDRQTGDMLVGDVGASAREEIDFLPTAQIKGANLGWNCREGEIEGPGQCSVAGAVEPSFTYDHNGSGEAVIGGYVIRDPALSHWVGRYVYGDNSDPRVGWLGAGGVPPTPGTAGDTGLDVGGLTGFGEDGVGHLYATAYGGDVLRLGESQDGTTLTGTPLSGSFSIPMAVAGPAGDPDRLFIAERGGTLKLRVNGELHDFLSVQTTMDSERGLLAVAVAPDYATSGKVYVYSTNTAGDLQLDEFRRSTTDATKADPATQRPILTIPHPDAANHNGGQLQFGQDGYLYLSTGDGGTQGDPENDAQRLDSLLGKIIRIDPTVDGKPPTPLPPAVDTQAPQLKTRAPERQRVLKLRGVVAYGRCDEACTLTLSARLKIGEHSYKLRTASHRGVANQRVRLKAALAKGQRQALRRALRRGRHPKLLLTLRARDGAGNDRVAHRTVRIKR